jgi:hypothetical protein
MTGTSKYTRLRFECRHWFERSPPGRIEFTKGCPPCGSHWCSGPVQTPSDSSSETHCSPRHSTPAQRSTFSSNKHYTRGSTSRLLRRGDDTGRSESEAVWRGSSQMQTLATPTPSASIQTSRVQRFRSRAIPPRQPIARGVLLWCAALVMTGAAVIHLTGAPQQLARSTAIAAELSARAQQRLRELRADPVWSASYRETLRRAHGGGPVDVTCKVCGRAMQASRRDLRRGVGQLCGDACRAASRRRATSSGGVETRSISRCLSASDHCRTKHSRRLTTRTRHWRAAITASTEKRPFSSTNWPPIRTCPRRASAKSFVSRSRHF